MKQQKAGIKEASSNSPKQIRHIHHLYFEKHEIQNDVLSICHNY